SSQVLSILQAIWEASGYPWSVRLKALLPLWLPWVKKRYSLTPNIEHQLLSISARQIDRRLKVRKTQLQRRLYGRTKSGTLLKHHIPIKTDSWNVKTPGFTEIDLVSHSGSSEKGEFIYALNVTDIYSTWVESRAVMGKGQYGVKTAMEDIERWLPFKLLGIDSDNGSEFINYHLKAFCEKRKIQFTRGRPYKKDDNAHIEQKNWTHVRKILGYLRYDSPTALLAINDLYKNELGSMMNLFQPSVKLVEKTRVGSGSKEPMTRPPPHWIAYGVASSPIPLSSKNLKNCVLASTLSSSLRSSSKSSIVSLSSLMPAPFSAPYLLQSKKTISARSKNRPSNLYQTPSPSLSTSANTSYPRVRF